MVKDSLPILEREILACERCPRLREHCAHIAAVKRRAYRDQEYWGRPVTSFGDPLAPLLVIGLAPGAHGANRTGRMFTGDRSGDFLYRALYETGFASQPGSTHRGDGLRLNGSYITASVRCAPPDNKPERGEIEACREYLRRELDLLPNVKAAVALGRLAFDNYLAVLRTAGRLDRAARFAFEHGREHRTGAGNPVLISSYHPSQQNTSTGRLTADMLRSVFETARRVLGKPVDV